MKLILKKLSFPVLSFFSFSLILSSCANHDFKIKGEINGADDKVVLLEKSDYIGQWITVDSVHTNKNGGFSFSFPTSGAPDIYRLSLNNQYIYIPVDSTETITVISSYDNFAKDFSLSGSQNAQLMEQFEKELHSYKNSGAEQSEEFKKNVYTKYIKDNRSSILSFYILTKTIDDQPLYDPTNPADRKYFGAVATGYKETKPNDPHTALLEQIALNAIKQKNNEAGNFIELEASEISLIDIDLPDENGKNVKLSDLVGKGKPVVVIFSILNHDDSPAFNLKLADIYNRVKDRIIFYNVSIDLDQLQWREAAKNLPWITVFSPGQENSNDVVRYNVFQIPSFFIYDAQGELQSRPLTLEELSKSLQ